MKMSRGVLAHVLLFFCVLIWGATFVIVQQGLRDASPQLFNLIRLALGSLVLLCCFPRHARSVNRRALIGGATVGFFLACGYAFQTTGLLYTTPSRSAFITGTVVVLVPLLSVFPILGATPQSRPSLAAVAGAIIAFCGLALLTTPGGVPVAEMFHDINRGDWLTLGCAIAFALHLLSISRTSRYIPYQQLALLQTVSGTVFLAAIAPFSGPMRLHWTPRLIFCLAITAVLATAVAFLIQSWAQSFLPATHAALIFTMEPVFAALTSYVVLHERLGRRALAGAALVLAGIAVTEMLSPQPEAAAA